MEKVFDRWNKTPNDFAALHHRCLKTKLKKTVTTENDKL